MTNLDRETLRRLAELAGFSLSDAELDALGPGLERALGSLSRLERLPLSDIEPTTQYRVL
jgi:Asp-tRNA(Asn)/Glu-tRNA(Gln) amidotransferase C subunit